MDVRGITLSGGSWSEKVTLLVYWSCYTEVPQGRWLLNAFLTVLGLRNSRSSEQHSWTS
jgi:hypothetical protein